MVNVAVLVDVPKTALIVAFTVAETALVVIVKVADVEPAGMVIVAGTVASAELELRVIVNPPVGAAPPRVKVPVEEDPPVTVVGFSVSPVIFGTLTCSVAALMAPL